MIKNIPSIKAVNKKIVNLLVCSAMSITLMSQVMAHNSGVESERPFYQAPYSCGEVWDATTYAGHSPDPNSLDMIERNDNNSNTSEGRAVVASASGTVVKSRKSNAGGWGITIDHGNGWVTKNSNHMQDDAPWPIQVGDTVMQGQVLGRTGSTGTSTVHQHYTQFDHYHLGQSGATATRAKFNGKSVNTHEGNPDDWQVREEIMSQNCAGNTFMTFSQADENYHLIYRPSDGYTKIVRINENGTASTVLGQDWAKGWTHFMGFPDANGVPHALIYNQTSGKAKYVRIGPNGGSIITLRYVNFSPAWTDFVHFNKGGDNYFLVYDSLHGNTKVNRISKINDSSTGVYSRNWQTGRTSIVPFNSGKDKYLLLYKGGNGEAKVLKINGSGNSISFDSVWNGQWSTGYTTLVPMSHEGSNYLFGYTAETGFAKVMKFKPQGQGVSTVKSMQWSKSWTAFSPYNVDQKGHLLIYKIGSGLIKIMRLKSGGKGFNKIWQSVWNAGWT